MFIYLFFFITLFFFIILQVSWLDILCEQGIAGNTNPLSQDYLVWANIELGNVMTYK